MSSATLTSLAILKVNIDQGQDYLDYLKPFVLDILLDEKPEIVNDNIVHKFILKKFGLDIPKRSIQIVLKRISKKYPLKKKEGVYTIVGTLPFSNINKRKTEANRHIQSIISGLIKFSKPTITPISSDERAMKALLSFLSEFDISCLKAYLRGTAIPNIEDGYKSDIVLVSKYVLKLQRTNLERFESFMILVQGHMLANALTCPDLAQVPETYKGVTFYLDTLLLLQLLGLDVKYKKDSIENLIALLRRLGGKIAVFSHLRDELKGVIENAAEYLDNPKGKGSIIREARYSGRTKSDLLLIAQKINDNLSELKIQVKQTPKYEYQFQIDETLFDKVLEDEIPHHKQRAKEHDINSVRSIYILRKGFTPDTVERSKAILVSSNAAFARAAYKYGQKHEELRQVSSVITNFSLANMAWLKSPMGAINLPKMEILSFSYAALRPSTKLLDKYLGEIERLEKEDKIKEQDHQLLRSKPANDELMNLTLGDEKSLSEETVRETLQRVKNDIKKEEFKKFKAEQEAHEKTQQKLTEEQHKTQKIRENMYWNCKKKAKKLSLFFTILVILFQAIIIFISSYFTLSFFVAIILTLFFVFLDTFEVKSLKIRRKIESWSFKYFISTAERATDLNLRSS